MWYSRCPYSSIAHLPPTDPALDRPLPSLSAPASSLLTRRSKPPGRRARGPDSIVSQEELLQCQQYGQRRAQEIARRVNCVEVALIFHAWYEYVTRSGGLCATEAARIRPPFISCSWSSRKTSTIRQSSIFVCKQ